MSINTSSVSVLSGNTLALNIFNPIGASDTPVSYAITGGADAAQFALVATGPRGAELRFVTPPNINAPSDAGRDNVYDVVVDATGAGQTITTAYSLNVVYDDHLGSTSTTSIIEPGVYASGRIDLPNDDDWFRFQTSGGGHQVGIFGAPNLTIYDASGQMRSSYMGSNLAPQHLDLPAGTYYLSVKSGGTGEYRVIVAQGPDITYPTDGDDLRHGSELSDIQWGNAGNDTLVANGGPDFVSGGLGNDSIEGGSGADFLRGDDGGDTMLGGDDFDDMHGNQGDDSLLGGAGDDWVVGGQGKDFVSGGDGADLVHGSRGDDTCYGGMGDDVLRGGQDSDLLYGEAGNDFLSGDRGDDTIWGGVGADTFQTFEGAGLDRIMDFSADEGDRVKLETPGVAYTVSQVGADTVVELGYSAKLVLVGVQLASLPDGWLT